MTVSPFYRSAGVVIVSGRYRGRRGTVVTPAGSDGLHNVKLDEVAIPHKPVLKAVEVPFTAGQLSLFQPCYTCDVTNNDLEEKRVTLCPACGNTLCQEHQHEGGCAFCKLTPDQQAQRNDSAEALFETFDIFPEAD